MIPTTSFAEKSDQALRFFVLKRSLRAASPRPSGTGDPFLFLRTGAEAPAYSRSASPRRVRFYSSAIEPASRVPVVSVLKTLNTHRSRPSLNERVAALAPVEGTTFTDNLPPDSTRGPGQVDKIT